MAIQSRGFFTCSTASTRKHIEHWGHRVGNLKLEGHSRALGEFDLVLGEKGNRADGGDVGMRLKAPRWKGHRDYLEVCQNLST